MTSRGKQRFQDRSTMRRVSDKALSASSFSVIVVFLAMALLGCVLLPKLPVRLTPSESLPGITVRFAMSGASSRVVESQVTSRLESMLCRIGGVTGVASRSWTGGGEVSLEFDRSADMQKARFEVSTVVRRAWPEFPQGVSYPSVGVRGVDDDAGRPFMSYTVNADIPASEIMAYVERNVKPSLSAVPGVDRVEIYGATPLEWRIEYDPVLLAGFGITADGIRDALSRYADSRFLGIVPLREGDTEVIRVAMAPALRDGLPDPRKIVIGNYHGEVVTLDKVARMTHAEAKPSGYFRINGLNSIYMNLYPAAAANQIELSRRVRERMAEAGLPPGYLADLNYDASEKISSELDNIYFRTGLTVLILLAFVGIITLNLRYLLLIALSLAMTICISFVIYFLAGVEIQLYSLAGITISLNLVIDNLIVMTEHLMRRYDLKAFPAILAATMTTVGALSVVFFLDDRLLLSLKDFVIVVIVNLSVSLLTALFLVPALMARIGVRKARPKRRLKKVPAVMMRVYRAVACFCVRHRTLTVIFFILVFGVPVFMLPDKIEGEGKWAKIYNASFGSDTYKDKIRPWTDRIFGGTLRLFVDKVSDGTYWGREPSEPELNIGASLPYGSTLDQMNRLVSRMEDYLTLQEGVEQFQTSVYDARRAGITVRFKKERQRDGYPYRLKADLISKALTLGGGSWSIWGLEDNGFNNDVSENPGNYRIRLRGYNYDELYGAASRLRDSLLSHKRIREVTVNSRFTFWKEDYEEFCLEFDRQRLAADSLSVGDLRRALGRELGDGIFAGTVATERGSEDITLSSSGRARDVWGLMNVPFSVGKRVVKLGDYAAIERRQTPPEIAKENQEYNLCLQYEYIGSYEQGNKVLERILNRFRETLPTGYSVEKEEFMGWDKPENNYLWLLLLIVAIIFFISAILFDSLRQPLAIIMVIPVSFVGVFLTFYLFDIKFGQGGFAAFILLCGITVNAAIYIINEYNSLRRRYPRLNARRLYFRAFRTKIMAVLLTVLSTVLGFIPFLVGDVKESFWYPLAAGTMGGLVMSLVSVFSLLPALVLKADARTVRPCINAENPSGEIYPD